MNEITEYGKSYQEFRDSLTKELTGAAVSFVRIGYLLKVARDTNPIPTLHRRNTALTRVRSAGSSGSMTGFPKAATRSA